MQSPCPRTTPQAVSGIRKYVSPTHPVVFAEIGVSVGPADKQYGQVSKLFSLDIRLLFAFALVQ